MNQPSTSTPQAVLRDLLIILIPLIIGSIVFLATDLDLQIQRQFYQPQSGWFMKDAPLFYLLYHYGNIPALVLSVASLIVLGLSFQKKRFYPWRAIAAWLVFSMIIGPGLITNSIFKDHFGRPRPRQIVEFGGEREYLPLFVPGEMGKGKSFPCGHATMGFYLAVAGFTLRKRKALAAAVFSLGCVYGTAIGLARIAQGGHFASDVLWAGGFTLLTGWALYYLFRLDARPLMKGSFTPPRHMFAGIIAGAAVITIIFLVLLASPYHKDKSLPLGSHIRSLSITAPNADFYLHPADSLKILYTTEGHGFPGCKIRTSRRYDANHLKLTLRPSGLFTEHNTTMQLYIPAQQLDSLRINAPDGVIRYHTTELVPSRDYVVIRDSVRSQPSNDADVLLRWR